MNKIYFLFVTAIFISCSQLDINNETASGIRQYKHDSLTESIKTLTKAIAINDTCRQCFLYRGFAYKDLKQYDKSLADCNSLIKIDKSEPIGYANRASVYYLTNDYKSALRDFSMAYKLDSSKVLLNPLCHMLFANGYEDSACIFYRKAIIFGDTTFDNSIKTYCDKKEYR